MDKMKKMALVLLAVLTHFFGNAQEIGTDQVGKDFLLSDGKIYVVVLIVITILAGLIFYVARIDRKLSKLEENSNRN